jgi:hypothetical protein
MVKINPTLQSEEDKKFRQKNYFNTIENLIQKRKSFTEPKLTVDFFWQMKDVKC